MSEKNFRYTDILSTDFRVSPTLQAKDLDMATEAHRLLRGRGGVEIAGVSHSEEDYAYGRIVTIKILNEEGAQQMGRDPGNYITIEARGLIKAVDDSMLDEISLTLAKTLQKLLPDEAERQKKPVLLTGLGNFHTLADAIGPKVISYIQPTNHFFRPELADELLPVAAFAPGVVGNTGIETADLIKGAADAIDPCCIIVIDALAAGSLGNLLSSFQLCDTGIRPGSGVQNHRRAINKDYLGKPVIAIGIPTVVNASSVIRESVISSLQELASERTELIDSITEHLLMPFAGNLVVTPKEADTLIPLSAKIIAAGLTRALHPGADQATFRHYMQEV